MIIISHVKFLYTLKSTFIKIMYSRLATYFRCTQTIVGKIKIYCAQIIYNIMNII